MKITSSESTMERDEIFSSMIIYADESHIGITGDELKKFEIKVNRYKESIPKREMLIYKYD